MNLMKELILKNHWFFLPYSVFLLICAVLLVSFSKPELHILLNKAHLPFFDVFFKYVTHLGDGMVIAILAVIFLFVKYRYFFAFLLGSLSAAFVVNLFKKMVFTEMYRPAKYFELFETYKLHLVEGVNQHSLQSFPSGHTAAAFSVFMMLALISKNNTAKLFLFFGAVIVAYSRVYISQHFIVDITAGSILAVLFMAFAFFWVEKWKTPWLNNSLLTKVNRSK
jgi:membrane-associated phospholipid phosphatase